MAKPNILRYLDGYPAPERETTVIAQPDFPFENYSAPDIYARTLDRTFEATPNGFTPKISTRFSYTNYILQSQTFGTTWTTTNATTTAAQLANPSNGTVDAYSLLETVANAEHYLTQAYTFAATPTTKSFFLKQNGRTWARVKANDGTTNFTAFFNLATGQVGTTANCTATITNAGFGYYRCAITFTPLAALGAVYVQPSTDGVTVSYAGNVTLGLYVWGAQLERASSAGPYISTLTTLRTISSPGLDYLRATSTNQDPGDLFAYLVKETSPQNVTSTTAQLHRMFARIPADETSYPGSRYIPLPSVTNTYGPTSSIPAYSYSPYLSVGSGYYDTAAGAIYTEFSNALYGPAKVPTSRVAGVASGGTFTLSYGANTTAALNWNDAGATIAAAINGLASVSSSGLTASVTNSLAGATGGSILIQWITGGTSIPVLMNAASLTISTSKNPTTEINDVITQDILLPDHFTITGHGFSGSVALSAILQLLSTGAVSMVLQAVGEWGVIDANTIWFPTVGNVSTFLFAAPFKMTLGAGQTILTRTKVVESFYLPGVSDGITTPADIPNPADLQQASAFVYALLNDTGYQTYQSEGPAPWMDSLIYSVKRVEINLDDL